MQRTPSGSTERIMSSSASLFLRSSSVSSSWALSKWSSIARLLRPVTKIISVMPAAAASSTAYWISGLSTIGSISLGLALVTGRKRLPRPATGNTAFLSLAEGGIDSELQILQHFREFFLLQDGYAQGAGLLELAAGVLAGDHEIGLFGHRAGHFVPFRLDRGARLVARHAGELAGEDEAFDRSLCARCPRDRRPAHAPRDQVFQGLPVVRLVEEMADRARDHRSDVRRLQQLLLGGVFQRRQVAEMARQVARRGFADVADAERVDQTLQGRGARTLELGYQVGGRLFRHAVQLG